MSTNWNKISIESGLRYTCEWMNDRTARIICYSQELGWFAVAEDTGRLAIYPTKDPAQFRRELNSVATVLGPYELLPTPECLVNGYEIGPYTIGTIGADYIVTRSDSKKILARGNQLVCWDYLKKRKVV